MKYSIYKKWKIFLPIIIALLILFKWGWSGPYLLSIHGNPAAGVERSGLTGISRGNCAHCHEQHASIGGSEPSPSGLGESLLFAGAFNTAKTTNPYAQSDCFCFFCHSATGSLQNGSPPVNYLYSVTFGGYNNQTITSILDQFNLSSYHNLGDLLLFVTGQKGTLASFIPLKISVPCNACHNPHLVQKHLGRSGTTAAGTIDTTRSALSLPSNRASLFTDTMSSLTANYQAPYWFGSTSTYEPDGSTGDQAAKTTAYPTFCTDCHNTQNTIYSTSLGRNLRQIDWSNEKHGFGAADESLSLKGPYSNATDNKVLSCLDCHEPHGSPNVTLIRPAVNGAEISPAITATALSALPGATGDYCSPVYSTDGNKELGLLCMRCHVDDGGNNRWETVHHSSEVYAQIRCGSCHGPSWNTINCSCCHFHGSVDPFDNTRRTF